MKKFLCLFLSVILLVTSFTFLASAEGAVASAADVPKSVMAGERVLGSFANLLGHAIKALVGIDETRIKKANPVAENWTAHTEKLFEGTAQQTLTAETWRMVELSYESEKTYADPFADVTLDLQLFGNGRLYTVPGFWDGGNTWRIRFVCPSAGQWQFKTVCSDTDNAALHGRTGTVNCTAYSGDLPLYQHGFVTTRYGEKYLTYDDGTPFYYLGDTHWQLAQEPVEMVDTICKKRVEQGFTVYESQPNDCRFNGAVTENVTEEGIADLKVLDKKFEAIAENGLTHANSQFFWPLSGMSRLIENHGGWTEPKLKGNLGLKRVTMPDLSDEAKAYLEQVSRYWVARFSAFSVIWTLGQEIDNDPYQDETSKWNTINNPYKYVAEYLAKYDPYAHPVTGHMESTGDTVAYGNGLGTGEVHMIYYPGAQPSAFRNVKAHSMYAAQWHPSFLKRDDYMSAKDFWYNGQGKPVVNYEGMYCYLWTKNYGARAQAWGSYLTGLYGCSWGGEPTWAYQNGFDRDVDSDDGVDIIRAEEKQAATWEDALEFPSSYQVGYMRELLEQTEWYNLIPRFNNLAYFAPCTNVYSYYASNKNNSEIVVYFYSFADASVAERINAKKYGGVLTGTVGSLVPFGKYTYQWFDPINGKFVDEGTFRASAIGTWFAGARPGATDMVLLIKKA